MPKPSVTAWNRENAWMKTEEENIKMEARDFIEREGNNGNKDIRQSLLSLTNVACKVSPLACGHHHHLPRQPW